jgi:hypothetical protein
VTIALCLLVTLNVISVNGGWWGSSIKAQTEVAPDFSGDECSSSFEEFAYEGQREDAPRTPPLPPWQAVADYPLELVFNALPPMITPGIVADGAQEIIIQHAEEAYVYQPARERWLTLALDVGHPNIGVWHTFVTGRGDLWAINSWLGDPSRADERTYPLFSRFEASTRTFRLIEEGPQVSARQLHYHDFIRNAFVIVDEQDMFWVFLFGDGIYRYDPSTNVMEKRAEYPDRQIVQVDRAPDGSIYFVVRREQNAEIPPAESASEIFLYRFVPDTAEIIPINPPPQTWVGLYGMLVDQAGRLWLGATGFLTPDGTWQMLHPDPERLYDVVVHQLGNAPSLHYKTSDGRLWFRLWADSSYSVHGTAWYHPDSGQGCMFTNLVANIAEDQHGNIWAAAEGMLYRYAP